MEDSSTRITGFASMNVYPPFELQVSLSNLAELSKGLTSFAVSPLGNPTWLKSEDGAWAISVDQKDLEHKFEVFTLRIEEAGSNLHFPIPTPSEFRPWPFIERRAHVLRRAEYIFKPEDPAPTIGINPLYQDAARPGAVPLIALSSCVVAAGLLFAGADQKRLLICVDWMPFNIVVTDEPAEIDDFIKSCVSTSLDDYALQLAG
ncbi:hypothetical protein [Mesorhizobium wenxiniae]|uniref:hypothetical protein n=1 Tax=Mesorhizobium wenxiniae TaxID=2014805 RepID=UPI001055C530|nr:hypothetical protein [Mesorhizobium wenxiniae]